LWSNSYVPRNVYWLYRRFYPLGPTDIATWYETTGRRLKQLALEMDVPFADVAAEFPKDDRYYASNSATMFDPGHYSPEGNQLLAALLSRHLADDLLLELIEGQ